MRGFGRFAGLKHLVLAAMAADIARTAVTPDTLARGRFATLDRRARLVNHDSTTFFDGTGDLIRTRPTGTNVNNIRTMLITRGGRQAG